MVVNLRIHSLGALSCIPVWWSSLPFEHPLLSSPSQPPHDPHHLSLASCSPHPESWYDHTPQPSSKRSGDRERRDRERIQLLHLHKERERGKEREREREREREVLTVQAFSAVMSFPRCGRIFRLGLTPKLWREGDIWSMGVANGCGLIHTWAHKELVLFSM